MSSSSDFELIHGQLHVTKDASKPEILGRGPATIRGAAYMQGPNLQGEDQAFPNIWATTMIGPLSNSDSPPPLIPGALFYCGQIVNHSPYSLAVTGDAAIFDNLDVNESILAGGEIKSSLNIKAQGAVESHCGAHKLHLKKNFDIPHPSKEGWRLTHTCVEGPEASVYIRGRVKNKTEIDLPEYWKDLVDIQSITVNLTPIGSHQDVIIKRWDDEKVYLQSKGGMPIDCFYYVMAERIDTEKLIPEYEGTIEDYPGDNSQRSIAGYHYNIKE
jgi:hypothetical protein